MRSRTSTTEVRGVRAEAAVARVLVAAWFACGARSARRTEANARRVRVAALISGALLALAGCGAPAPEAPRPAAFDPDSVADAFAEPVAALFLPFGTRGVLVGPDGSLDDGAVTLAFEPAVGGATAPGPRRIAFEERWRPVAHWRRTAGAVRFDFEAVALPHAAPRDTAQWTSVHVTITNTGASPARASLVARLAAPEARRAFVAFDRAAPDSAPVFADAAARTPRAWCSAGGTARESRWERTLAPGETAAVRVVTSTYAVSAGEMRAWVRTPHARRVDESRAFWDAQIARAARFELNDPEVEAALKSAWVVLLSCRERRGGDALPIGGPFHYRDVWLRDGARAVSALAVSGYGRESRALANGLQRLEWGDGTLLSQRGQFDGLGQGPWAWAEASLRGGDTSGVAALADAALRTWRYRQWVRDFSMQSGWPLAAMLPTAEPRDNELTRAQLVGHDAWALAGSRATVRLLRAAGRATEADSVEATIARDLGDFRRALERTGRADVPPSWQNKGRDWGNLAVGWPCRALPADDPHLAALAARMWGAAGGPGLVTYNGPDSLHGYAGADLGTWALLAGRSADAARVLDALLHWRNAAGEAAEIVLRHTGSFANNLPPHPTSAAALVALVRNSVVFDDDDTLRVALGARAAWWRGGGVHGAPTRWGALDLELRHDGDDVHARWGDVPVWTELTLPAGTRLAAPPAAPLVAAREGRAVLAPPHVSEARVRVVAEGAR